MNHAFIMAVHAYPEQFKEIVGMLQAPNHFFFVNVDKKSDINNFSLQNVLYQRNKVEWGGVFAN